MKQNTDVRRFASDGHKNIHYAWWRFWI